MAQSALVQFFTRLFNRSSSSTAKDQEIARLRSQLATANKSVDPNESYWNTKRPQQPRLTYPARTLVTNLAKREQVDPRIFFTENNSLVPVVRGSSVDAKANAALSWVITNIKYITDKEPTELWQFPFETLVQRSGDCEDGAILMANMMIKSGVPYWRIRLNAGDVQGGGHAYLTYLREADNAWYVMDWCYWPDESLNFKKPWKTAKKYFGIWFSFNRDYIFADETLDRKTQRDHHIDGVN